MCHSNYPGHPLQVRILYSVQNCPGSIWINSPKAQFLKQDWRHELHGNRYTSCKLKSVSSVCISNIVLCPSLNITILTPCVPLSRQLPYQLQYKANLSSEHQLRTYLGGPALVYSGPSVSYHPHQSKENQERGQQLNKTIDYNMKFTQVGRHSYLQVNHNYQLFLNTETKEVGQYA